MKIVLYNNVGIEICEKEISEYRDISDELIKFIDRHVIVEGDKIVIEGDEE